MRKVFEIGHIAISYEGGSRDVSVIPFFCRFRQNERCLPEQPLGAESLQSTTVRQTFQPDRSGWKASLPSHQTVCHAALTGTGPRRIVGAPAVGDRASGETAGRRGSRIMLTDRDIIQQATAVRLPLVRRLQQQRTAGQRLAAFAGLQETSFRVLCASPAGYRHFLRRNLAPFR